MILLSNLNVPAAGKIILAARLMAKKTAVKAPVKPMSKTEDVSGIADATGLTKKQVICPLLSVQFSVSRSENLFKSSISFADRKIWLEYFGYAISDF